MTHEQQILWKYLHTTFTVTDSVRLYFQNTIAGSEFLTYAATKLYFALELSFSYGSIVSVNQGRIQLFNSANAIFYETHNDAAIYNSGAAVANYESNELNLHNIYFSRLTNQIYLYMKFIGFKLTIS